MEMLGAIADRRSIRRFQEKSVPQSCVKEILRAGILAPSSKNRQPWQFVVAEGKSKADALAAMEMGLEREKESPLLPESAKYLSGAAYTLDIMRQAPVIIFVVNPLGLGFDRELTAEERIYEICNAQSIGAAMENMTLAATELGLGSLWICDTYFAQQELSRWLSTEGELAAAMAIGYEDETPFPRPRRKLEDVTEWRE